MYTYMYVRVHIHVRVASRVKIPTFLLRMLLKLALHLEQLPVNDYML